MIAFELISSLLLISLTGNIVSVGLAVIFFAGLLLNVQVVVIPAAQ